MADRKDYYFKQPVSESELDDGFTDLENADRAWVKDQAIVGVLQGGDGAQHAPVANLTVDVSGPMYAYDNDGQRIFIPGPLVNVNVAQDSSAVATAVAGSGNEKWISVAVKFTRVLSDPRVDGNSATVYFRRDESYEVVVTQGAEAATGTATRPSLDPDAVLLFDVKRTFGQTQIFNAAIDTTRRQDVFVLTGPMGGLSLRAGTLIEAVAAMLDALNTHILTLGAAHPASSIAFESAGDWHDGSDLAAGNAQDAIDEILTSLALDASAGGGAALLGISARTAWLGGRTNPGGVSVFAAIDKIITDLAATTSTDDGAQRIGAQAVGGLAAGSARSQLNQLDTGKAGLAGSNTWTAFNNFQGVTSFSARADANGFGTGVMSTQTPYADADVVVTPSGFHTYYQNAALTATRHLDLSSSVGVTNGTIVFVRKQLSTAQALVIRNGSGGTVICTISAGTTTGFAALIYNSSLGGWDLMFQIP